MADNGRKAPLPRLSWGPIREICDGGHRSVADTLGVCRDSTRRPLTIVMADRIATNLGLHPAQIWDDWWIVSEQQWRASVRYTATPLAERGISRRMICDATGADVLRDRTRKLNRRQAEQVCEAHGLDPVDVWGDEWEWVSP